jgi:two-component system response regulator YesN
MNIIIADDEPIIRIGLRTLIDWDLHGLKLVGEASDGEEALQFIANHQVDILVTDIRMPRMDGLELIRRAKEQHNHIGVLVLSCLDDFSFVKEAMKLGARDYILKPTMEPEELVRILHGIGEQLTRERKQVEHLRQLNIQIEQSRHYQLEVRIRRYIEFGIVDEDLEQELFASDQVLYSMLICSKEAKVLAPFMNTIDAPFLVSMETNTNERLILINYKSNPSSNRFYQESYRLASEFLSRMTLDDHPHLTGNVIYIGPPIVRMEELRTRLDFHRSQMHHRFYADQRLQIVIESSHVGYADFPLALNIRNDILKSIAGNNKDGVLYHIKRLASMLQSTRPDLVRLQVFIFETIGLMIGYARDQSFVGVEQFEQQYLSMESIRSNFHIDDLIEWLKEVIFEYWNCLAHDITPSTSNNPFIRKAMDYMRLNYQKPIGTTDIAAHVRLSRSYLSDLYSREVGESLIETLTRIRIDEACKRLKSANKKIYEVAEEVGFADSKTFSRTFRRIVGCSPKEYERPNK